MGDADNPRYFNLRNAPSVGEMVLSIMTLGIMTPVKMSVSIMTLNIMTLSIKGLFATLSISNNEHNSTLSIGMLRVIMMGKRLVSVTKHKQHSA